MTRERTGAALGLAVALAVALASWRWWVAPWRAHAGELAELEPRAAELLAELELDVELAHGRAAREALAWRAPGECVEVYRVRTDERYRDESVAVFLGRSEQHQTDYLALARDPARRSDDALAPVIGVLLREGEDPRVRELWWSASEVGPGAPDFACRRRPWDPLEDALALGWPKLPDRASWAGEAWTGAAVEGRCHETVCVEPDGSFGHAVPCRARPWSERLLGARDQLALIVSDWDDGHDPARPELGIRSSREVLIDEGRPLFVRATIDQRWAGVRRVLTLTRLDDCGARSLGGGEPVEQIRARFAALIRARLSPRASE